MTSQKDSRSYCILKEWTYSKNSQQQGRIFEILKSPHDSQAPLQMSLRFIMIECYSSTQNENMLLPPP